MEGTKGRKSPKKVPFYNVRVYAILCSQEHLTRAKKETKATTPMSDNESLSDLDEN